MKKIRQIQLTQGFVILSGLILVWGGFDPTITWAGLALWIIVGNVLLYRLRCSQCARPLMCMPYAVRAFGLSKCAFCGFDHRTEDSMRPNKEDA